MARRILLTADAPQLPVRKGRGKLQALDVTVLMGDPRLPDQVKRGGTFNPEDLETVRRLRTRCRSCRTTSSATSTTTARWSGIWRSCSTDLVFNLCDEGWNNDPFKELHVPALLEVLGIGYTGAGPAALAACYDKGLVRAVAQALDVPVPLESYVRPGDQGATLPSVFPALLKPNHGDSSQGITKDSVVTNEKALLDYLDRLRAEFPKRGVLVQEFLTGAEYSVQLIGNPDQGLRALPILEVDYSQARRQAAEDPRLRIEVGARQPLLDADQVSRGDAGRPEAAAADRPLLAAVRAARAAATTPASTSAPTPRARSSCSRSTPTPAGAGTAR